MTQVLALDPAPCCIGWALGSPEMERPLSGSYAPPAAGPRHGVMLCAVRDWLDTQIKTFHVHTVCLEAPFCGPNREAFGRACKLVGVIELVCDDHEIGCFEVTPHVWRKRFIGRTTAPTTIPKKERRAWLKAAAISVCGDRGWPVEGDDAADACGVLDHMLACRSEAYRERFYSTQGGGMHAVQSA